MSKTPNKEYIVLRGIEQGNTFFTSNKPGEDESEAVKLFDGTVAYEIVGYANTSEEAQALIERSYREHGTTNQIELRKYIQDIADKIGMDEQSVDMTMRILKED